MMSQTETHSKKEKLLIIEWLIENFPQAFFKKSNQIKPLQIGIYDEIIDFYERLDNPPFSKKTLRDALSYYSSSPGYLSAQQVDVARVDLFGNEVDIVTEEQAKYAYQRYQERYVQKKNHEKESGLKTDNQIID